MVNDPIADMLTRIRNANKALHETTAMPTSRMKEAIASLLAEEGYIESFRVLSAEEWNAAHPNDQRAYGTLEITLKYGRSRERIITGLKRVSTPGRRVYAKKDKLPRVLGGMGTAILSTSGGLVTARTAAERGVGGEVVCFVW